MLFARVIVVTLLILAAASPPSSAGVWFDIGSPDPAYVYANLDPETWELFPPLPFGPFPEGTLVFEEFVVAPCDQLWFPDRVCGPTKFIRGFQLFFNDGGCGCAGYLQKPTTIRLSYDPAVVTSTGFREEDLQVIYMDSFETTMSWASVDAAVVNAAENYIEFPWYTNILAVRQIAIVTPAFVPVLNSSWGQLKAHYR